MLCSWAYEELKSTKDINIVVTIGLSLTSSPTALSLLEAQRLSRGGVLQTHVRAEHGLGIVIE